MRCNEARVMASIKSTDSEEVSPDKKGTNLDLNPDPVMAATASSSELQMERGLEAQADTISEAIAANKDVNNENTMPDVETTSFLTKSLHESAQLQEAANVAESGASTSTNNDVNNFIKGEGPRESIKAFLDDEIEFDESDIEEATAEIEKSGENDIQEDTNVDSTSSTMKLDKPKTHSMTDETCLESNPHINSNDNGSPSLGDKRILEDEELTGLTAVPDSNSDSESSNNSDSDSDTSSDSEDLGEASGDNEGELEEEDAITGPIISKNELVEEAYTLPNDYKVPENAPLEYVGDIIGLVEQSAIIKANTTGEFRVLKDKSVLCFEDKLVLGPLFEVFGRLQAPVYRVKFNTDEEFQSFKDKKGAKVFYVVPESQFVFTQSIKKLKGTDASNCHDEELPEEEQDFSDDEQELAAKQAKLRKKKQNKEKNDNKSGPPQKKHTLDLAQATFTSYGFNTTQSLPSTSGLNIPLPQNPPPVVHGQQGSINYNFGGSMAPNVTTTQNNTPTPASFASNPYGVPYNQVQHQNPHFIQPQPLPQMNMSTGQWNSNQYGQMPHAYSNGMGHNMPQGMTQNFQYQGQPYYGNAGNFQQLQGFHPGQTYGQGGQFHHHQQYMAQNASNGPQQFSYNQPNHGNYGNTQIYYQQMPSQAAQPQQNHNLQNSGQLQTNEANAINTNANEALKQLQQLVANNLDKGRS